MHDSHSKLHFAYKMVLERLNLATLFRSLKLMEQAGSLAKKHLNLSLRASKANFTEIRALFLELKCGCLA